MLQGPRANLVSAALFLLFVAALAVMFFCLKRV